MSNSSLFNHSFFRFRWKFNHSLNSSLASSSEETSRPRLTLLTFILYILCTLVALALLIVLLAVIIFIYRKHCLPPSILSRPIIEHRYRSNRKKKPNRMGIHHSHVDQDTRTEKTMITTIRQYY